jgi:cytoskeletal protein CcmA (bactofilin family)
MSQASYPQSVTFSKNMEFNESLEVNGDLKCTRLIVHGDLTVSGSVMATFLQVEGNVTAGRSIEAGLLLRVGGDVTAAQDISARNIEVGKTIVSKRSIIANGGAIVVGHGITAGRAVEAKQLIHCGGPIQAGSWVMCPSLNIKCSELRNRLLPFGREFWANLPMLTKWRDKILDPKMPWLEIRRLPTQQEARKIAETPFGHWSLEGQLRVFLGAQGKVDPPDYARVSPRPIRFGPINPPKETPDPKAPDADNPLTDIVLDPTRTPFPDYSNNPSYLAIMQTLRQDNILNMDLRQAYADLNIALADIFVIVNGLTVPDPAVKKQILLELSSATNVRLNATNMTTFINSTILAENLKVQYVGGMVNVEDGDACSGHMLGIFQGILGILSGIPGAGSIFKVFSSIIGLITNGWAGGFQDVNAAYDVLVGQLSAQFGKLLTVNGQIAQTLLTDWGKLERANALIIDGTLAWPSDDSSAINGTANAYEIQVFKILFPIRWSLYASYDDPTDCNTCENTVWVGNGYMGRTAYWLTTGPYWWADCKLAENELTRIGVSIGDLTQGTGLWGSTIWAEDRKYPAASCDLPPCCTKGTPPTLNAV